MTLRGFPRLRGFLPNSRLIREMAFYNTLTFHTVERREVLALLISSPCLFGHRLPRVLVKGFNGLSLNVWTGGICAGLHATI